MKKVVLVFMLQSVLAGCSLDIPHKVNDPYDYKELVTREVKPVKVLQNAVGRTVVDFGKDAVGWLELDGPGAGEYEIVMGELVNELGEVTNA